MTSRVLRLFAAATFIAAALCADVRDARKDFLKARTAVAEGKFREALDIYRKVIEELPDDAVVRYEYAQLLRDLNVTDEAIRQAREAVRLDPSLPEGHRLLGALEYAGAGKDPAKLDQAIEQLQEARRLFSGDATSSVTLARALLARGRAAEAAHVLDEMPEARSQPGLMRLEADAKAKSGHTSDAEAIYRQLLEDDPTDREIVASLVDLYEDADRLDEALSLLASLEKKDPDNAGVSERIAIDLARAGRFDDAEKRARALASKRPENREVRRLLAEVLFQKGDAASAERILRDLAASDSDDEATRRALADVLLRERRLTDAQAVVELARKKSPDAGAKTADPWAAVELGYIAFLQKKYPEARRILEPLALGPSGGSARATRILLGLARESEDWASGLSTSQAAASADSSSPEWAAAVAEFRLRSGDKARGQADLGKLAASDDPERILAAADAYTRVKNFADAARVAREAVQRFPDNTEALFRLGSSLERAGQISESEKTFQQLLSLRPRDAATLNYLGYMWADRNVHLEEALAMLEKAVGREPNNGAYRDSLGWAYFRLGRLDAAAKNLLEAHKTEPEDATIEEHLGDLSERQGNVQAAVEHWKRALTLKPDEPDKIREKLQKHDPGKK